MLVLRNAFRHRFTHGELSGFRLFKFPYSISPIFEVITVFMKAGIILHCLKYLKGDVSIMCPFKGPWGWTPARGHPTFPCPSWYLGKSGGVPCLPSQSLCTARTQQWCCIYFCSETGNANPDNELSSVGRQRIFWLICGGVGVFHITQGGSDAPEVVVERLCW